MQRIHAHTIARALRCILLPLASMHRATKSFAPGSGSRAVLLSSPPRAWACTLTKCRMTAATYYAIHSYNSEEIRLEVSKSLAELRFGNPILSRSTRSPTQQSILHHFLAHMPSLTQLSGCGVRGMRMAIPSGVNLKWIQGTQRKDARPAWHTGKAAGPSGREKCDTSIPS